MPEISPINTLLLVVLLGFVIHQSRHWHGPSQHMRLQRLEKFEHDTLIRLQRIEENYLGIGREIDTAIGKLSGEVRELKTETYEIRRSLDRMFQRGCGFEDCPRAGTKISAEQN